MDELLIPPSAFTNRVGAPIGFRFYDAEPNIPRYSDQIFQQVNGSCQMDLVKTVNVCTHTTEQIFTAEDLKSKIETKKAKYLKKLNTLKQQSTDDISKMSKQIEEINCKLSNAIKEKESATEELLRLKFYISGIEDRDAWLNEKQRLTAEIECLQYTVSDQKSIIESLNIQISSMEKIQSIQEREIHKNTMTISSNQLSQKEPNNDILLRAWRHKVLSLLVQHESTNIVHGKEKHKLLEENHDLINEIKRLHGSLEQLNLRFDVQQAQLSTNEIVTEKHKRENEQILLKLQNVSRERDKSCEQLETICQQMNSFCKAIETEVFVKFDFACSKIENVQRRLNYANSRFPMIQGSIKRQRNMTEKHNRLSPNHDTHDHDSGSYLNKIHQLEESLAIINAELRILRQERDKLIVTMEEDSASFYDRLNQKKEELRDEMEHLQSMVTKYESSVSKASKDLELAKQENYRLKSDYDNLLSSKHAEVEKIHGLLTASRSELSHVSMEYSELKRSTVQTKKFMEEQIVALEQRLIQCDNQWKKTCDQLSAERDLLKLTIRQEGILSKLKTKTVDRQSNKVHFSEKKDTEVENIMKEVNELAEELSIDHDKWD